MLIGIRRRGKREGENTIFAGQIQRRHTRHHGRIRLAGQRLQRAGEVGTIGNRTFRLEGRPENNGVRDNNGFYPWALALSNSRFAAQGITPTAAQSASAVAKIMGQTDDWMNVFLSAGPGQPQTNGLSDIVSKGYEVELTYNPTRNWRIKFTGAQQIAIDAAIGPEQFNYWQERLPVWTTARADSVPGNGDGKGAPYWTTVPVLGGDTPETAYYNGLISPYLFSVANVGKPRTQVRKYRFKTSTSYQLAGNIGLPLLDRGFINISAQFNQDQRTDRSIQFRTNTFGTSVFDATVYAASNPAYAAFFGFPDNVRHIQRQGAPDSSSARAIVNAGYEFENGTQLYAFANLSTSRAQTDGNYRYPTAGQPVMDTPVRLQDGSIFRWNQIFPYGLSPQFAGYVHDKSIAGGWKGEKAGLLGGDLAYDISGRYGHNQIIYKVFGTINAAVGPTGASQMQFRPIDFRSDEKSFNTDFTWTRDVGFHTPLALSFGTELRKETYTIKPGDDASIKVGTYATVDPYDFCTGGNSFAAGQTLRPTAPQNMGINCALSTDPVYRTLPVGPNVFSGTPKSAAGEFSVDSKSAYVEAATEITDKLFVDLAARYEDFSSFGSTSNYKAAARYAVKTTLAHNAPDAV